MVFECFEANAAASSSRFVLADRLFFGSPCLLVLCLNRPPALRPNILRHPRFATRRRSRITLIVYRRRDCICRNQNPTLTDDMGTWDTVVCSSNTHSLCIQHLEPRRNRTFTVRQFCAVYECPRNCRHGDYTFPVAVRSTRARRIRSNTSAQLSSSRCRNNRIDGYQGLSLRSSSQRQSAATPTTSHTGTPNAPARCAEPCRW